MNIFGVRSIMLIAVVFEELINAFKIGVYKDSLNNKNRYGNYEIQY